MAYPHKPSLPLPLRLTHDREKITMKAIVVTDHAAGRAGMKPVERPEPQGPRLASLSGANYDDLVVRVHASGFTGMSCRGPQIRVVCGRTSSLVEIPILGVWAAFGHVRTVNPSGPTLASGHWFGSCWGP